MSQTHLLVTTLKRLLKTRGVTYAQVAVHLELSEASVKRQFSQESFSLHTLEAICELIHLELGELIQAADQAQARVSRLTEAQEAELVRDPRRVLVAICVLNHWTMAQIVATYQISEPECISYLLQLERLDMIRLMPENRGSPSRPSFASRPFIRRSPSKSPWATKPAARRRRRVLPARATAQGSS